MGSAQIPYWGFALGDSQTVPQRTPMVSSTQRLWPLVLRDLLNARDANIGIRIDGRGGDPTGGPLTRIASGSSIAASGVGGTFDVEDSTSFRQVTGTNSSFTANGAATSGSGQTQITLSSFSGTSSISNVVVGSLVSGTGIASNTWVTSISGSVITINNATNSSWATGNSLTITPVQTAFIEKEMIGYTYSGSGNTLTVVSRPLRGTTAAAHAAGVAIRPIAAWQPATNTVVDLDGGDVRVAYAFERETPDFAFVFLNTNDGNYGFAQSTVQANTQAIIKALKFGAVGNLRGNDPLSVSGGVISRGWVSSRVITPDQLPSGYKPGSRFVVMKDNATNGGPAARNTGDIATISTDLSSSPIQTVWEAVDGRAGVYGWRRVADNTTAPTHVKRIVVVGTHFRAWATGTYGRDAKGTPPTRYTTSDGTTANSILDTAQIAAVSAETTSLTDSSPSVIFTDLFGYMNNLLMNSSSQWPDPATYSTVTSWHVADGNNHLNDAGHEVVAQAILNGGPAGTGWPSAWTTAFSA